jgi:hypothetical protein
MYIPSLCDPWLKYPAQTQCGVHHTCDRSGIERWDSIRNTAQHYPSRIFYKAMSQDRALRDHAYRCILQSYVV